MMVESVTGLLPFLRPDDKFQVIFQPDAAKVRRGIGFVPGDGVEYPESQVLHDRADAEDVMIRARHPYRRRILHHPPRFGQPGASERVVGRESLKLIPLII